VNDFAHYVVEKAARRADLAKAAQSAKLAKEYDPVSIISLSCDILLKNAFRFWVSAIHTGADFFFPRDDADVIRGESLLLASTKTKPAVTHRRLRECRWRKFWPPGERIILYLQL
jgi:hypothetical protein